MDSLSLSLSLLRSLSPHSLTHSQQQSGFESSEKHPGPSVHKPWLNLTFLLLLTHLSTQTLTHTLTHSPMHTNAQPLFLNLPLYPSPSLYASLLQTFHLIFSLIPSFSLFISLSFSLTSSSLSHFWSDLPNCLYLSSLPANFGQLSKQLQMKKNKHLFWNGVLRLIKTFHFAEGFDLVHFFWLKYLILLFCHVMWKVNVQYWQINVLTKSIK